MIIEEGWARVSRDAVELGQLGPGSFFGEMALLGEPHRSATVTAVTSMVVDVLNPAEFAALLQAAPSVRHAVTAAAEQRHTAAPT
jgi:voltage-gated potassium channel